MESAQPVVRLQRCSGKAEHLLLCLWKVSIEQEVAKLEFPTIVCLCAPTLVILTAYFSLAHGMCSANTAV